MGNNQNTPPTLGIVASAKLRMSDRWLSNSYNCLLIACELLSTAVAAVPTIVKSGTAPGSVVFRLRPLCSARPLSSKEPDPLVLWSMTPIDTCRPRTGYFAMPKQGGICDLFKSRYMGKRDAHGLPNAILSKSGSSSKARRGKKLRRCRQVQFLASTLEKIFF